ncbi:unnamed protein product [Sphagnum troendelagicum]|uniref:Uncharacterized protein n=1 Tax=Sphagnum troendelagicum TaxID=128251 RepID=A0ABP0TU79_9BRYO
MDAAAKEIWKELASNKMIATATAEVERYLVGGELSLGVSSSSYKKQLMMSPQRSSWILKHNSSFGVVDEVMKLLNHSRGTQESFLNTILWE